MSCFNSRFIHYLQSVLTERDIPTSHLAQGLGLSVPQTLRRLRGETPFTLDQYWAAIDYLGLDPITVAHQLDQPLVRSALHQ